MKDRLSSASKDANNKKWYREYADRLDSNHYSSVINRQGVSSRQSMKVNYDLFNNVLNLKDLEYVCKPFGDGAGELPAQMVNRDISSGKIKAMLGMEQKRPFSYRILAVNPEATTRKEQEEFGRVRDYVVSQVMAPIKMQMQQKEQEAMQGGELSEDEIAQLQQQIQEEMEAMTPPEVKQYMQREHQDPAEVMAVQLLTYLVQDKDVEIKFDKALKHGLLSAIGCLYVGEFNGEPELWNVNSMRLKYDESPDLDYIEDGEMASCEYPMTPSTIVKFFGKELKDEDLDRIYEYWNQEGVDYETQDLFAEIDNNYSNGSNITVLHNVWKALRKIGFLKYIDEEGEVQESIVDETYKFNPEFGDLSIEWEWLPEVYETWKIKINDPIYVKMQPIPGQFKDINNLRICKLPYFGIIYDNMNSIPTSLMDRLKFYQYYYNIIMYRIELLTASDKGKKVMMNIGMIPSESGIDLKEWQYFFESSPFMWYDPQEEGNTYNDVSTIAKVIDLSLASDIQKYIEIAEYIKGQQGKSVGITEPVEGQISARDAVANTQQSLTQSSHILEPYFNAHDIMKRNVLAALIEKAKICYADRPNHKLSYVLDDMSLAMFELDSELLDNSTYGLYLSNSGKIQDIKNKIEQLAHAAMQNQTVELSDMIAIMKEDDIITAQEKLKAGEDARREFEQKKNQDNIQAQQEATEKAEAFEAQKAQWKKEEIILKEEEKRKTILQQAAITGMSFNPDLDKNNNGVNDFLELAKMKLDEVENSDRMDLEKQKFEHQKKKDENDNKNEKKKLSIEEQKIKQKV